MFANCLSLLDSWSHIPVLPLLEILPCHGVVMIPGDCFLSAYSKHTYRGQCCYLCSVLVCREFKSTDLHSAFVGMCTIGNLGSQWGEAAQLHLFACEKTVFAFIDYSSSLPIWSAHNWYWAMLGGLWRLAACLFLPSTVIKSLLISKDKWIKQIHVFFFYKIESIYSKSDKPASWRPTMIACGGEARTKSVMLHGPHDVLLRVIRGRQEWVNCRIWCRI